MHLFGVEADAVGAMLAAIAATWIAALWQFWALGRRLGRCLPPGPRIYVPLAWLRASFPQFMVEGFYLLLTYCDVIVLERFVAPDEVGVYYAATKLVSLVAFVYFSVAAAAAHKFTAVPCQRPAGRAGGLHARLDPLDLRAVAGDVGRRHRARRAAAGPVRAGLHRRNGAAARPASSASWRAPRSARSSVFSSWSGTRASAPLVYAVAFVVNIGLNLAFVPHFGLMGAAVATSAALVIELILLFTVTKRRLGLHVFYWGGRSTRAG